MSLIMNFLRSKYKYPAPNKMKAPKKYKAKVWAVSISSLSVWYKKRIKDVELLRDSFKIQKTQPAGAKAMKAATLALLKKIKKK